MFWDWFYILSDNTTKIYDNYKWKNKFQKYSKSNLLSHLYVLSKSIWLGNNILVSIIFTAKQLQIFNQSSMLAQLAIQTIAKRER